MQEKLKNVLIKPFEAYYNFRLGVVESGFSTVSSVIDEQVIQTQKLLSNLFFLPGEIIDQLQNRNK